MPPVRHCLAGVALTHAAGLDAAKLAPVVLVHPHLLQLREETLQRKYDAVLAHLGQARGRLLVQRQPDVLKAAEGRVGLNLQTLQQLGASPQAAETVLLGNGRLGKLDLQSPKLAARMAFWQQTYGVSAGE